MRVGGSVGVGEPKLRWTVCVSSSCELEFAGAVILISCFGARPFAGQETHKVRGHCSSGELAVSRRRII